MTHNKSFGLVLTSFNEVRKCTYYILGGVFFSSTDQTCVLNILQGTKL